MTRDGHDNGTWVWAKPGKAQKPVLTSPPLQPVQSQKLPQLKPGSPNAAM
jgi:hypothetical protein